MVAKLTDLGFSENTILETIVSTYNQDGTPNAAPMGTVMQDQKTILIAIFNLSQTSCNLKISKCAVINLTSKIEVFYKTAFKEANPNRTPPQEWFEKAETVNAPKLQLASATIDVSVAAMAPIGTEKTKFTCNIEQISAPKMYPDYAALQSLSFGRLCRLPS